MTCTRRCTIPAFHAMPRRSLAGRSGHILPTRPSSRFKHSNILMSRGKKKVEDRDITSSTNYKWNEANRNIELNTGSKGVFQKIAYIHKDIQASNDITFLEKLYWAKERRNEVGHALNNTDMAEIEKITYYQFYKSCSNVFL